MVKLAVIGAGNLGQAIVKGIHSKLGNECAIVATRNQIDKIQYLSCDQITISSDNIYAVQESDIILLAVKPYKIQDILDDIKPYLNADKHTLISVATGITTDQISQWSVPGLAIYRAMQNTAIEICESVTCICSPQSNKTKNKEVEELFNHLGQSIFISEDLMDAATVLGACGIAYVLRFIRAMIQGGIEIGFDAQTATNICEQTVRGAASLLIQNGLHPEQEIDKVTTPKGCTIRGLNEMEHQGFSSSLIKGIISSYDKIS